MKVSDLVNSIYKENVEMNAIINSEEIEFETKLKLFTENAFNDTFPIIATKNGIEKFEQILDIQLDSNQEDLEYRRNKVITKLTTTPPLSFRWLQQSLDNLLGVNNYIIVIDYANYSLTIQVSNRYNDTAETIYNYYRPLIPANMDLDVTTIETEQTTMYFGIIAHEGEKTLIKVREET